MKMHRFYTGDIELRHEFWMHEPKLIHQWYRVLRFREGQEVVLFDGLARDRLYKILKIEKDQAYLQHVTDFERKTPAKDIYLLWSLLKKDNNDWILQKATEIGVSHFLPLLADRSQKSGFNLERARKIVIEAAEQCGRSDIPAVREPMRVDTAISQLHDKIDLYICEQGGKDYVELTANEGLGLLVGPEGGWSDNEIEMFAASNIKQLNLHDFTLRAETAAIVGSSIVLR